MKYIENTIKLKTNNSYILTPIASFKKMENITFEHLLSLLGNKDTLQEGLALAPQQRICERLEKRCF